MKHSLLETLLVQLHQHPDPLLWRQHQQGLPLDQLAVDHRLLIPQCVKENPYLILIVNLAEQSRTLFGE